MSGIAQRDAETTTTDGYDALDGPPSTAAPDASTAQVPLDVAPPATVHQLRTSDEAWDRFVEGSGVATYPQLTPWAEIKGDNGWRAVRVVADGGSGPIGAQVLLHRLGPTPFSVGFAPRGPVATRYDEQSIRAFTAELRRLTTRERLSHVTVDPEVEDHAVAEAFAASGWRPADTWIDPESTRVVDLRRPESELWGDLRSKWRQYAQKARRSGVVVVEGGADDIDEFYAILVETATRAGFPYRTAGSYRRVFECFAGLGRARLLFARLPDGSAGATIMLVRCGDRVVEPYGGMTPAGAELRANYLVKWEAIRSSREAGAASYDMWGLVNPGIAQFKAGFGGREVNYVGAWDLVRLPPLRSGMLVARRLRRRLAGIRADHGPGASGGSGDRDGV